MKREKCRSLMVVQLTEYEKKYFIFPKRVDVRGIVRIW